MSVNSINTNALYYQQQTPTSSNVNFTSNTNSANEVMFYPTNTNTAGDTVNTSQKADPDDKTDGKVSFGEGALTALKGLFKAAVNTVVGIVTDPVKAVGTGLAIAASIAFPPVGVALATVGAVTGAISLGKSAVEAYNCYQGGGTDADTLAAIENCAGSALQVGLSLFGMKGGIKAMKNVAGSNMASLSKTATLGDKASAFIKDVKTGGNGNYLGAKAFNQVKTNWDNTAGSKTGTRIKDTVSQTADDVKMKMSEAKTNSTAKKETKVKEEARKAREEASKYNDDAVDALKTKQTGLEDDIKALDKKASDYSQRKAELDAKLRETKNDIAKYENADGKTRALEAAEKAEKKAADLDNARTEAKTQAEKEIEFAKEKELRSAMDKADDATIKAQQDAVKAKTDTLTEANTKLSEAQKAVTDAADDAARATAEAKLEAAKTSAQNAADELSAAQKELQLTQAQGSGETGIKAAQAEATNAQKTIDKLDDAGAKAQEYQTRAQELAAKEIPNQKTAVEAAQKELKAAQEAVAKHKGEVPQYMKDRVTSAQNTLDTANFDLRTLTNEYSMKSGNFFNSSAAAFDEIATNSGYTGAFGNLTVTSNAVMGTNYQNANSEMDLYNTRMQAQLSNMGSNANTTFTGNYQQYNYSVPNFNVDYNGIQSDLRNTNYSVMQNYL